MRSKVFFAFVLSVMASCLNLHAQTVSPEAARAKAMDFFSTGAKNLPARKGVKRKAPAVSNVKLAYTSEKDGKTCFYVYNNGTDGGFVIVGGDEVAQEILAYVPQGHFDYDKAPDNLKWWLGQYEQEISSAKKFTTQQQQKSAPRHAASTSRELFTDIPDLISTKWNQGWPYNAAIPGSSVTGCVATAMAQIMNYWKWPISGEGSLEFSCSFNNQTFSADFGNTTYDWGNMLDTYTENGSYTQTQIDAVSTLMYHVGVADRMMYYPNSAIGEGGVFVNALPQYFKYSDRISLLRHGDYLDDEWEEIIYCEIQAGRPVYLEGGGHAFVLHGYTTDQNMFSVNFGWNGAFDGYYQITGTRQYFYDDSNYIGDASPVNILIHIEPNTISHPGSFSNVGDTITVDGIRYDLIGPLSKTVEVTYAPNNEIIYSGEVTIPESIVCNNEVYTVTKIGRFGLANGQAQETWGVLGGSSAITSLRLPNTLRSIARGGLSENTLTELHIPDNVELIAEYAFNDMRELTSISLPSKIQYIGNFCFHYCEKLEIVELPASIKAFGMCCFNECSALSLLILKSSEVPSVYMLDPETTFPMDGNYTPFPTGYFDNCVLAVPFDAIDDYKNDEVFGLWKTIIPIESIPDDYGQIIDVDNVLYKIGINELIVVGYNGNGTNVDLIIPSVVTYNTRAYPVTSIADNAFYGKFFCSVTIEEGIRKIGKRAISGCNSISHISLPASLEIIDEYAFAGGCIFLTSIEIPENVHYIGDGAFSSIYGLTSIKLPEGLTFLGSYVFGQCENLQQIKLPSNLKRIPNLGWPKLPPLETLVLPNCLDYPPLFEGHGAIAQSAFKGMTSLKRMICYTRGVPKTDFDYAPYFEPCIANGTLYVPADAVSAYQSAPGWQDWGEILPIVPIDSILLKDIYFGVSETDTISIRVFPLDATEGQIFYSSSNPKVATISHDGKITAHEVGKAVITAETMDGKIATCTVTVKASTVGTLVDAIDGLPSGRTTLKDVDDAVDSILER